MSDFEFVENEKEKGIDLVIEPKAGSGPLDEETLIAAFEESPFGDHFVILENFKNALAEHSEAQLKIAKNQSVSPIRFTVAEKRDAAIKVDVEADKMSAKATITGAYGGKNPSPKAIVEAAKTFGVVKGFSKEHLIKIAHKASRLNPGEELSVIIANGKLPINGRDARIKRLVQSAQERILKPKEREDGTVDMRDLGDIICVKQGDLLAQRVPPTPGKEGFKVTSEPIPPTPGKDITIQAGEGTRLSNKDANYVIAEIVGLPKFKGEHISVDKVFETKEVNIATGHIKFEGSVIITGDVCEGMKIVATGDVTVGGFVESAYIEAGGDVTIQKGIIGHQLEVEGAMAADQACSVTVRSGGSIFAKYAQYGELVAKFDVRIETQMLHCSVKSGRKIWVGREDKANGKLIGGYIHAGRTVHAGVIGAPAGSHVYINFQNLFSKFKEKQEMIATKAESLNANLSEVQAKMRELKKDLKTAENKKQYNKTVSIFQMISDKLGTLLNSQEMLERRLNQLMQSVFVEATEKLYQEVTMEVDGFHERSRREYGPSKMFFKERKVHIEPLIHETKT